MLETAAAVEELRVDLPMLADEQGTSGKNQ